jgi:hypothetical protein
LQADYQIILKIFKNEVRKEREFLRINEVATMASIYVKNPDTFFSGFLEGS